MKLSPLALLVAVGCASAPAPVPAVVTAASPPLRAAPVLTKPGLTLPTQVHPLEMQLELTVVPGEDTFAGTVSSTLQLDANAEVVWLNGTELTPGEAFFTVGSEKVAASVQVFPPHFLAVVPGRPLPAGRASLSLREDVSPSVSTATTHNPVVKN